MFVAACEQFVVAVWEPSGQLLPACLPASPICLAGTSPRPTEEAKGIDALLALAVAGEETAMGSDSQEEEAEGGGGYARQSTQQPVSRRKKSAAKPRGRRAAPAADVDWEEEPADAGAMDDDGDEDFAPPPRRTPYSTPAKAGRLPRPGSAHATPRRTGSRGGAGSGMPASSPGTGLRGLSPYLMGSLEGGDMLDLGMADLGYIASPGEAGRQGRCGWPAGRRLHGGRAKRHQLLCLSGLS